MLLTMLFDDEDENYVSALFQVGDQVRCWVSGWHVGVAVTVFGSCCCHQACQAALEVTHAVAHGAVQVLQLKQKPHEGRLYDKAKEDLQEQVSSQDMHAWRSDACHAIVLLSWSLLPHMAE